VPAACNSLHLPLCRQGFCVKIMLQAAGIPWQWLQGLAKGCSLKKISICWMNHEIDSTGEKGTFRFRGLRWAFECQAGKSGMSPFRPTGILSRSLKYA
jgi:hypothetical protein